MHACVCTMRARVACVLLLRLLIGMDSVAALLDTAIDEEFIRTPAKWPAVIAKDRGLRPLLITLSVLFKRCESKDGEDKDEVAPHVVPLFSFCVVVVNLGLVIYRCCVTCYSAVYGSGGSFCN